MGKRRLLFHEAQPLVGLIEKSELLVGNEFGGVNVDHKLATVLDEYGIPDRVKTMKEVLGSIAGKHVWTGDYDLHHMSWPRTHYTQYADDDGTRLGINFRNAGSLRVVMPRQLHDYTHAVTEPPPVPSVDVMRQYALEHGQVGRLYDTIKSAKSNDEIQKYGFPEESSVEARRAAFKQKIEMMEDGQIGIMPEKDYLYDLELDVARKVLRGIARANGISNARNSKRAFFGTNAKMAA